MKCQNKKGFSLTEIVIVIIVLGVLASFALPQYGKAIRKSHERDAILQLRGIHSANEFYKSQVDTYLVAPGGIGLNGAGGINDSFDLRIMANDMTYNYTSNAGGTAYTATAEWTNGGGDFTVEVHNGVLGTANNPCCAAGTCPTLANNCP